ncbi:unnamed protein product [Paramecium pentaurelia]|uniref:Uncharacterized protein n=1 Tax=Paramecium pentaurelia TaxID=43138 RepID=A0A8S1W8W6_9CILI|nr:unnamed protein product [Paramecium pentaurelia]
MKKPIAQKINMFAQKIGRKLTRGFETIDQVLSQPVDHRCRFYQSDLQIDKFESFHMRTRDPFEKGSQVQFCYIRLSDRQMLLKYGMVLKYNKYDSKLLRVEYLKLLQKKESIWIVHRFTLKNSVNWTLYINCIDTLYKIKDLQLEKALSLALQILVEKNSKFKETIEVLEKQLFDESAGYHEYYAIVYRLERLRLYCHNIDLIDRIMKGVPFDEAIKKTEYDNDFYDTNRYILKIQFDQMRSAQQI